MPFHLIDTRLATDATVPVRPGRRLGLYVCGPTVYDGAHVGHARTYLYFDVVRRLLEGEGARVRHVMNITDFEDKITDRAVTLGQSWRELARTEERKFIHDLDRLRVLPPHVRPRASAYVPRMISIIKALERRGRARWEGDSLLYVPPRRPDPRNFPIGAQLSELVVEEGAGPPAEVDRAAREFLLWRRQLTPNASWSSPWGQGAPGWHLECLAMARSLLGIPVDLHGGGIDLVFPHHYDENEVALALDRHRFARRYLHTNFVTEDGEKMSKSTGRLVPLRGVLETYGSDALRLYLLSPSYRDRLEWDERALRAAARRAARLRRVLRGARPTGAGGSASVAWLTAADRAVRSALLGGLRIGDAFRALDDLADRIEGAGRNRFGRGDGRAFRRFLERNEARLGLGLLAAAG